MTQAGVKAYRRLNPGSKLKTAVKLARSNQDQKLRRDVSPSAQEDTGTNGKKQPVQKQAKKSSNQN